MMQVRVFIGTRTLLAIAVCLTVTMLWTAAHGAGAGPFDGKWTGKGDMLGSVGRCDEILPVTYTSSTRIVNGVARYFDIGETRYRGNGTIDDIGNFRGRFGANEEGYSSDIAISGPTNGNTMNLEWENKGYGCKGTVQISRAGFQNAPPPPTVVEKRQSRSIEERLTQLKKLLDTGLVTEEEAAEKRRKILEGI